MLMTGQDLVDQLRETYLDDLHTPPKWTDEELIRNLNYAEVQACRRAHLLIDRMTASDAGTAAVASVDGQRPLCLLTLVANTATYYLSQKILQVKRCQLKSMTYPLAGPVSLAELDERQSGWWGTAGTVATFESGGVKATGSLTSAGINVSNGDTVLLDTKTYTFRTALTPTEGEVLIGATVAITLDNLKAAINHTGTPNTDYKCAAVHPTVSATTNSDTGQVLEAKVSGVAGNSIVLERTGTALTPSGTTLSGGVDPVGHPDYFINEPGNTITFVKAPSVADTAYLVVSRIPLTPFTLTTWPEIEEKYHMGLCDWAAHLAFMKPGEDTLNLNLSKLYEDAFIQQFGPLRDASSERIRKSLAVTQRMRPRVFGS